MLVGRNVIATLAQIHPLTTEEYCIKGKCFIGNIYLGNIPIKAQKSSIKFGYKPQILPNVERELSVVVKDEVNCLEILRALQKITKNRFTTSIVDIFHNEEMKQSGKKSVLLAFEIFQNEKTLTSEEIEEIINQSMQTLVENVDAMLRSNA